MKTFQEYLSENIGQGGAGEMAGDDLAINNLWRVLGARYGEADVAISNLMKDEIDKFKKMHGEDLKKFIWTVLKAWHGMGGRRVTQMGLGKAAAAQPGVEPAQPGV